MARDLSKETWKEVVDNLRPAEIITNHIKKTMDSESIDEYSLNVDKFEDLLCTEIDDEYIQREKEINERVERMSIPVPVKMTRDNHESISAYKQAKKEQYRKRLIFRELVKLAKRKGLWLLDEEEAVISHDKKKIIFMDRLS